MQAQLGYIAGIALMVLEIVLILGIAGLLTFYPVIRKNRELYSTYLETKPFQVELDKKRVREYELRKELEPTNTNILFSTRVKYEKDLSKVIGEINILKIQIDHIKKKYHLR